MNMAAFCSGVEGMESRVGCGEGVPYCCASLSRLSAIKDEKSSMTRGTGAGGGVANSGRDLGRIDSI